MLNILKKLLTEKTFENALHNLLANAGSSSFLLAVSGGADSVVLLHLFHSCGLSFEVAHVNYKLRGKDSDADQKIVQDFCTENHIVFHLYEVSEKDKQPENSVQSWARNLRYGFFRQIQHSENLENLVTAHHLNDQLETFIINLSKASGIKGLSGIPASDNGILRPLLNFTKDEIYRFAEKHRIEFREDLSNQKNNYLRNFIRNQIAPRLFETNENFLKNFSKSLAYLNQTKNFAEEKIEEIEREIILKKENLVYIQKKEFSVQPDFVKFEILRRFGFKDEKENAKIFAAEKGKVFHSPDYQLMVEREHFVLMEKAAAEKLGSSGSTEEIIIAESLKPLCTQTVSLTDYINLDTASPSDFRWEFNAEALQFPLKLRKKKTGDLFFPIGMIGKKTLAKFFKDEKIPILAQQKIWILCDGKNEVLGIIPFRQDRRFAADSNTKSKILITF